MLVNGEGQVPHSVASTGEIVREKLTPSYDYIAGDATVAYGKRLEKAWRHVVFVKGIQPFIVLYDELVAPQPATFQFMLHGLRAFTFDQANGRARIEQPKAAVEVAYLAPVPIAFKQTEGFVPAPTREFPNHWHLEAGTTEPRKEMGVVTVLMPQRAGQATGWVARRVEHESTDGAKGAVVVEVEVGGKTHRVRFPRPGTEKAVEVVLPAGE